MFMLLPLEFKNRRPSRVIPAANALIITANVFFYLLMCGFGWVWVVGPQSGPLSILLYGFCHAGFWHLVLNMWVLWIFGNPVNRILGNKYYLACYLGTILLLGLFARLFFYGNVIGASGGIFAMIVIACMLMPSESVVVGYGAVFPLTLLIGLFRPPEYGIYWFIRGGTFIVPALWCLILIPILELFSIILSRWTGQGGVWNLGHLLGMLCGLAAVLLLPTRITMRRSFATSV